jgi:hypothetical protein
MCDAYVALVQAFDIDLGVSFLPRGYRVSEFSMFSGEDGKITLEHVGQFIL